MSAITLRLQALLAAQHARLQEVVNVPITLAVVENTMSNQDMLVGPMPKNDVRNQNMGHLARSRKAIEQEKNKKMMELKYVVDNASIVIDGAWVEGAEMGNEAIRTINMNLVSIQDLDDQFKNVLKDANVCLVWIENEFVNGSKEQKEAQKMLDELNQQKIMLLKNIEELKQANRKSFGFLWYAYYEAMEKMDDMEDMTFSDVNEARIALDIRKKLSKKTGIASGLEGLDAVDILNRIVEQGDPRERTQRDDYSPMNEVEEVKPATLQDLVNAKKVEDGKVVDTKLSIILNIQLNGDERSTKMALSHRKIHGKKYHEKNHKAVVVPTKKVDKNAAKKQVQYSR